MVDISIVIALIFVIVVLVVVFIIYLRNAKATYNSRLEYYVADIIRLYTLINRKEDQLEEQLEQSRELHPYVDWHTYRMERRLK